MKFSNVFQNAQEVLDLLGYLGDEEADMGGKSDKVFKIRKNTQSQKDTQITTEAEETYIYFPSLTYPSWSAWKKGSKQFQMQYFTKGIADIKKDKPDAKVFVLCAVFETSSDKHGINKGHHYLTVQKEEYEKKDYGDIKHDKRPPSFSHSRYVVLIMEQIYQSQSESESHKLGRGVRVDVRTIFWPDHRIKEQRLPQPLDPKADQPVITFGRKYDFRSKIITKAIRFNFEPERKLDVIKDKFQDIVESTSGIRLLDPLQPFVKWPGGKSKELAMILRHTPPKIDHYYEPYVGGGAVGLAMISRVNQLSFNDKGRGIYQLWDFYLKKDSRFWDKVEDMNEDWQDLDRMDDDFLKSLCSSYKQFSKETDLNKRVDMLEEGQPWRENLKDIIQKGIITEVRSFDKSDFLKKVEQILVAKVGMIDRNEKRLKSTEDEDVKSYLKTMFITAIKQAYYNCIRDRFNTLNNEDEECLQKKIDEYTCMYYFIRTFSYSGMFRYSKDNTFNVPYGGRSYNNANFQNRLKSETRHKLASAKNISIDNEDGVNFLKDYIDQKKKEKSQEYHHIFLDPPYDSEFSTYEGNPFELEQQKVLAEYLLDLSSNLRKDEEGQPYITWMMVIKCTDTILNLYDNIEGIHIHEWSKRYDVSFMDRNSDTQRVSHLIITNYDLDSKWMQAQTKFSDEI